MKKKIFLMILACLMMISSNTSAYETSYRSISVTQFVDWVGGDWYDTKGNLVLKIGKDYTVNGCKIMSVNFYGDSAGFYKVKINDNGTYRDIDELIQEGHDYHETLYYNKMALRRTKEPKYFESVGGIYLGMSMEQVVHLYGAPEKTIYNEFGDGKNKWATFKYEKLGLDINFDYYTSTIVNSIKIYKTGDRKFDWSGLSANNSISDFEKKYNGKYDRSGRFGMNIGGNGYMGVGENLRIDEKNRTVTLGLRIH